MRYPLPYAFARGQQLLLEEADDGALTLWMPKVPPRSALGEVLRKYPRQGLRAAGRPSSSRSASARPTRRANRTPPRWSSEVQGDADLSRMMQELPAVEDLLESADDAPIIRMLNALLTQAARDGASDIHIEPYERTSSVRFRIDGTLRDVVQPNRALHAALISRLKIMADLDIAEKRLPQDGRITLRIGTRAVDVRVSTLPIGARRARRAASARQERSKLTLESVGMQGDTLARFEHLIAPAARHHPGDRPDRLGQDHHAVRRAAAGSTRASSNIMTVEDPIEYELPGVGQTQVNAKIDLTFAKALRAILRQDPDVIMIGEIRDLETAQIAIQASLTGHLVLATLHTNDARQRRHAPDRHGHRALPAEFVAAGRAGAAAGAQAVPGVRAADGREARRSAATPAARPATRAAPASSNCWWPTRPCVADPQPRAREPRSSSPPSAAACARCAKTASGWSRPASPRAPNCCA